MPADPPRDPSRRRSREELDRIFGDVLPDTTSDERGQEPADKRDDWYEENRPPHHDSQ